MHNIMATGGNHLQHVLFFVKRQNFSSHNASTCVQSKHIADEWIFIALLYHHVSNLDYRIFVSLWKNS